MKKKTFTVASFIILVAIIFCFGVFISDKKTNSALAEAATEITDSAVYSIKNAYSGYYLDICQGAQNNNVNTLQWTQTGNYNQLFMIRNAGNNDWQIFPYHVQGTSYALDVENASLNTGTSIVLYQNNGANNQKFRFMQNTNGSYTIRTKISNYQKCIAVRNDSTSMGEIGVQAPTTYNTANWILEKVLNGSDKGKYYSVQTQLPTPSEHPIFGVATHIANKDTIIYESFLKQTRKNYPKQTMYEQKPAWFIRYFRYAIPVNARVVDYNIGVEFNPYQQFNYRLSETYTKSQSKKTGIEQGLSVATTQNLSLKGLLPYLNIGVSAKNTITASMKESLSYDETTVYTAQIDKEYSLNFEGQENKPYCYFLEERGFMYLYIARVYKIEYTVSTWNSGSLGWYTHYEYTENGKTCMEEIFNWELLTPTYGGFNPYELNASDGKYYYVGNKTEGVIYV